MDNNTAVLLAKYKLEEQGLTQFKVLTSTHKGIAGQCLITSWSDIRQMRRGWIKLSSVLIPLMSEEEAIDTILHEIGHAMTKNIYKAHGPEWRKNTLSIGGSARRTHSTELPEEDYRYRGVCRNGHESLAHRLTQGRKTNRSCGKCSNKFSSKNMFNWYDRGVLVHRNHFGTPEPRV